MSRQPKQAAPSAPAKMPGDHLSSSEERAAHEATLGKIKGELEAERARNEALDRRVASELAGSDLHLAQTQETPEQRAKAFDMTIALVRAEMEAQNAENPPRSKPMGIDEASIEAIKAEMAKAHKRVVLPAG